MGQKGVKYILTVFGTRPEALKLWPILKLSREEYADKFVFQTYFTNQSEERFIFDIRPDYSARSCCGTTLAGDFGRIYSDLEWFLENRNHWDAVMVQGDTFSTFAGALAAYFHNIPVIHVEAGLRTHKRNPWPEEMIRRQVDGIAWIKFAPTQKAAKNLIEECNWTWNDEGQMVGNTIIDRIEMERDATWENLRLSEPIILISLHRRESWELFGVMMTYLIQVIERMPNHRFIFLTHPNGKASSYLKGSRGNVCLEPALDYPDMLIRLRRCLAVITDSGGLIEEAAYFHKPCFILRDETEREESVQAGLARLMGRGKDITAIPHLMETLEDWFRPDAPCPYGDGRASQRILDYLRDHSWGK